MVLYLGQALDDGRVIDFLHPQVSKTVQDKGLHAHFAAAHGIVIVVVAHVDACLGDDIGFLHGKIEYGRVRLVNADLR